MNAFYAGIGNKIVLSMELSDLSFNDRMELFSALYRSLGFDVRMSKEAGEEINKAWTAINREHKS